MVLPDNLALGETEKGELSRKVVIRNKGTSEDPAVLSLSLGVEGHPSIGFKTNRCGATLAKGKSCEVVISFKQRGLYNGSYSGSLQINSATLPITASVINNPDPDETGTPELELTMIGSFDSFAVDKIPYRTINVKNIGTGTANDLDFDLPADYSIRINRCPSTLKVGHSCTIQVLLNQARQKASAPNSSITALLDSEQSGSVSLAPPVYDPQAQALILKVKGSISQALVVNVDSTHTVDFGDGTVISGISSPSHTYSDNSDYDIKITKTDTSPGQKTLNRNSSTSSILSNGRLKEVLQWGGMKYPSSMSMFLASQSNFTVISATDQPDTSNVVDMSYMFSYASSFDSPLNFNTSNVINMNGMFISASSFDSAINFDTLNVTNMNFMFWQATSFDQDLSGWCVFSIKSKPSLFDTDTPNWNKVGRQPIWGTCPTP